MSEAGEIYWAAVEPIWDEISIYDGPGVFLAQLGKTERWRGLLFSAHWCRSEVWNGGLHQFFCNSTGVLAPEAVEGLREMDLLDLAAVVQEAMFFLDQHIRETKKIESKLWMHTLTPILTRKTLSPTSTQSSMR